jgi:hypothetical protein
MSYQVSVADPPVRELDDAGLALEVQGIVDKPRGRPVYLTNREVAALKLVVGRLEVLHRVIRTLGG